MSFITPTKLSEFLRLLEDDLEMARKPLSSGGTPFQRRVFVRTLFAVVEGSVFALKQAVLTGALSAFPKRVLLPGEVAMLSDESFQLNANGEVKSSIKFQKVSENILFCERMLTKVFDCQCRLKNDTKGWKRFQRTVNVRNRITHPKTLEDYQVSDAEIAEAVLVNIWFSEFLHGAVKGIADTSAKR